MRGFEEGALCTSCTVTVETLPERHCELCADPDAGAEGVEGEPDELLLCSHCHAERPAFEHLTAAWLHGGAIAEAIHRLKYGGAPHLAAPLAALARAHLEESLEWAELLSPVSLHPKRLRSRGYDQSALLARALAIGTGAHFSARALVRVRETPPQVGQARAGREQNLAGAFAGARALVEGRRVLLVDDVVTTGSTANEAARALLEAGAAAVRVVALTRAG